MDEFLQAIEGAFLDSMASGYAAEKPRKGTIVELPCSKTIEDTCGDFRVLDTYLVTQRSDSSTGMTVIWHKGDPVWSMSYGGRYGPIAIPFLKECLRDAYVKQRRFFGGRGPAFVRDERFVYVNHIQRGSFDRFFGEETIFDLDGHSLGYHWYHGMALIYSR